MSTAAYCAAVTWTPTENAEIARGLRRRDPDLLDHLIEQYQHRLFRYLVHVTGDRQLSEDLFQETWLRVLERGRQYDGRHAFVAWLLGIARNLAIDTMRRKRPASLDELLDSTEHEPLPVTDAAPGPFDRLFTAEQRLHVAGALDHLPAAYREVLVLRFQEELPLEEIARVVAAPLSTVKSRLYRALEALAPLLEDAR
jgi:RNA polymerase sigma-70 factor (ECF subfamily)